MTLTRKPYCIVFGFLVFFFFSVPGKIIAQLPSCGTDEIHSELLKRNPDFKRQQSEADTKIYNQAKSHRKRLKGLAKNNGCGENAEEIYTIPVVVHIMHLPEDSILGMGSNISDAQIQAGIDHLNDAFRNQGDFSGGPYHSNVGDFGIESSDVRIEFVLARRDEQGNSSDGINRISTDYSNLSYREDGPSGFSSEDTYLKSLSFWDSQDYANVWLVNEICQFEDSLCGVAGYAYLAGAHGASYDGIVNEARYWGSSVHASKVHIHEFGHYLNLYHTFNDPDGGGSKTPCENGDCLADGDYVCDTPPDNSSSAVSCNSSATANTCSTDADDTSANNPFTSDVNDLYENYMDYGYQSCQNTFTPGQKERMRLALAGIRSSLLSSSGSIPITNVDAEILSILSPSSLIGCESFSPSIVIQNKGSNALTSATIVIKLDGNTDHTFNWTGNLAQGNTDTLFLNSLSTNNGSHQIQVFLQGVNGLTQDEFLDNDSSSSCFEVYAAANSFPYCQDFESLNAAPDNWMESNPTGSDVWSAYTAGNGCSSDYGNSSYYLDNWSAYYSSSGADLDLYLSSIDLGNLQTAKFYYSRSYKRSYSNRELSLDIDISTDCGASFSSLKSFDDAQLASSSGFEQFFAFAPSSCDDWETDSIDLSNYVGNRVLIRIRAHVQAYYAQNLYLDNICIKGSATVTCTDLALEVNKTDESCLESNGTATVSATSGLEPFSYVWNTQPPQQTATASGLSAGNYEVIVTDANGCADTAAVSLINVGELPTAGFNFFSQELQITLSNTSSSSLGQSFAWDLGDGNSSTNTNPAHTYAAPGTYTICLFSTNDCGTDTLCREITLNCLEPDAGFSWSANELSVSFQNASIREEAVSWDFGDGNSSTDENPSHSYSRAGTYNVCMIASSICGTDTFCQEVVVSCPGPEADFQFDTDNLAVSFSEQAIEAESFIWDFGDGQTSDLANPTHSYDSTGSYTACLIVTNICGTDTLCKSIEVDCPQPSAGFRADASGLNVILIDESILGTTFVWDFGDGLTSNLPRPFHTYELPGSYTVCQTVINDCGQDSTCKTVVVSCPGPNSAFSYQVNGLNVSFLNNSTPNVEYNWDFGDGNTSKEANPFHSYDSIGVYLVSLEASTKCGADTSSIEIEIASATSIAPDELLSVQVYPNPSSGIFFLEFDDLRGNPVSIQVHDVRGRKVFERVWEAAGPKVKEQIDLSNNSKGIYFLNIEAGKKRFVQKLSLKK